MVEYVIEGKIAVIIGCTDDEVEVIIPDTIENYRVGKIKENSFLDLPNLTKVIIPKYVKVIGAYAFSGCKNLTNVTLSEGIETIEDWAFSACGITNINLPKSLKYLGANSFLGSPCKKKILSTIDRRVDTDKQIHIFSNNSVVFSKKILDLLDELDVKTLNRFNESILSQLNSYNKYNTVDFLDLPFVFNNSSFVLAFHSKTPCDRLKIELSSETLAIYGNYKDDNEDYILAKLNVMNDHQLINNAYIIVPFCDDLLITAEEISYYEIDDETVYVINCKAKVKILGSGNPDREFALDVAEIYRNKFKLEFQNEIIKEEMYVKIDDEINALIFDKTKEFISNIEGAPFVSLTIEILKALVEDTSMDSTKINNYIIKKTNQIYHSLSDYESFENFCFDIDTIIDEFKNELDCDFKELQEKYGIKLLDEDKEISNEEIYKMKDSFIENEVNFELYIKTIRKIYKGLSEINDNNQEALCRAYLDYYAKGSR